MLAHRLLREQTQPEFQEIPEPHAGPGQVVVKVAGSGLCHTTSRSCLDSSASIGQLLRHLSVSRLVTIAQIEA